MEDFDLRKYLADNVLLREDRDVEMWDNMGEEERLYTLLSVVEDPDEAEDLVDKSFYELPDAVAATVFENKDSINEGQFSWMTQDTDEQIGSEEENTIEVYMVDNMGNEYFEPEYDGYGNFGGEDYYDVLATMNGFTQEDVGIKDNKGYETKELRSIGIQLAYGGIEPKEGEVLFPALVTNPAMVGSGWDFTQRPEDDPNQSWDVSEYDEYDEEDDWGDYEDDEDEVDEFGNVEQY